MGIGPHLLEPYGDARRQDQARGDRRAGRPAAGEVRRRHRDHADAARRGQDHHHGRARPGDAPHRQAGHHRDPPAVDGPDVRHQGRRRRRRLQPGRADGAAQPAPHRRLPRRHRGPQPALGDGRQPPAPGQRARPRPAQHHLAARARRQRPRAAQHRRRPRRARLDGVAAPDRLRHHRRLRGDGDPRARHVAAGDLRARLGRIVVGYTPRRRAGHRRGHRRRRRDGRDHARRDEAQPAADAGEHAGARARRPVRQHRPRQLVGRRRPDRHPRRRLPHHRGRVRRRHGRRAVLQHQVPRLGPRARRRRASSPRCGRSRRTPASTRSSPASRCPRSCSPRTPTRSHIGGANLRKQIENVRLHGVSPVVAINAFPDDHPSEHEAIREIAADDGRPGRGVHALRRRRRGRHRAGRGGRRGRATSRRDFQLPLPRRRAARARRSRRSRPRSTAPTASTTPRRPPRQLDTLRAQRLRQPAGLHRQDAPVDLVRRRAQGRADRLAAAGARGAGLGRRRVRLPDLRRHAHDAGPGRARRPPTRSTSTTTEMSWVSSNLSP